MPWFLPYCYGESAPTDTLVKNCKDLTAENVNSLVKDYNIPYTHLKTVAEHLNDDSKEKIAYIEKLDTVLWFYEDLACEKVDTVIEERLDKGEIIGLSYGKLMERSLTIKIIREERTCSGWGVDTSFNKNPTKAMFFNKILPTAEKSLASIK